MADLDLLDLQFHPGQFVHIDQRDVALIVGQVYLVTVGELLDADGLAGDGNQFPQHGRVARRLRDRDLLWRGSLFVAQDDDVVRVADRHDLHRVAVDPHLAADPHPVAQRHLRRRAVLVEALDLDAAAFILDIELGVACSGVEAAGVHRGHSLDGDVLSHQRAGRRDGDDAALDAGAHRRAQRLLGPVARPHPVLPRHQRDVGARRLDGHAAGSHLAVGHLRQRPPHAVAAHLSLVGGADEGQAEGHGELDHHVVGRDAGVVGHL